MILLKKNSCFKLVLKGINLGKIHKEVKIYQVIKLDLQFHLLLIKSLLIIDLSCISNLDSFTFLEMGMGDQNSSLLIN